MMFKKSVLNDLTFLLILIMSSNCFTLDYGIGVAYIVKDNNAPPGIPRYNIMQIYESNSKDANIIGKYIYEGGWKFKSVHVENLEQNLVEFDYEYNGIPVDSVDVKNQFARCIIGFDDANVSITGWVKIKKNHTEFFLWRERLKQVPLFFLDNKVEKVFYDQPDGNIVNISIKPSEFENEKNYIMHPIKTEGIWMKVKVVTPSDHCDDPINPETRILWIKYLNDKGRPLVWYYTRGC